MKLEIPEPNGVRIQDGKFWNQLDRFSCLDPGQECDAQPGIAKRRKLTSYQLSLIEYTRATESTDDSPVYHATSVHLSRA